MRFRAGILAVAATGVAVCAVTVPVVRGRSIVYFGPPPDCFANNSRNGLTFGPTASSLTRPGCTESHYPS